MKNISQSKKPLSVCHQCDWVCHLPELQAGERALCPRCEYSLLSEKQFSVQSEAAWAVTAIIMLILALCFEFIRFEVSGISHSIVFIDTVRVLFNHDFPALGALVFLTTVLLPSLYLITILYLDVATAIKRNLPGAIFLARKMDSIKPWMMSDVFIVGVLVSLIKIVTLANIQIGPSFLAFCAYALLMLKTVSGFDLSHFWQNAGAEIETPANIVPGRTAHEQNVASCMACKHIFHYIYEKFCPRCGHSHTPHHIDRLQITWALILTSAILFIPSNLYPILKTTGLGGSDPQTIVGGVLHLVETGSWPIALVIFLASILIPIAKIFALCWLCIKARTSKSEKHHDKMRLYFITEMIGKWSMVDVFVVAVLASLVQAGVFMTITPGPAILYFAAMVIVTMIAAMSFDTRLIWQASSKNTIDDEIDSGREEM